MFLPGKAGVILLLGCLSAFCAGSRALADGEAQVLPRDPQKRIQGLDFPEKKVLVKTFKLKGEPVQAVVLDGFFKKQGWSLIIGQKRVSLKDDGGFQIKAVIKSKTLSLQFIAVDPAGKIEKESVTVEFAAFSDGKDEPPPPPKKKKKIKPKRFKLTPGLGLSVISYSETSRSRGKVLVNLSEIGLTGKVASSYVLFPPYIDVGVSGYFTLLPVSSSTAFSNGDVSTEYPARFLGLNFRVGWRLPWVRAPWAVILMPGFYYTTMLVTDTKYGFNNMSGPQFFPVVAYAFDGGYSLGAYAKFSPVASGLGFLSMENREIAGGGSFNLPLENGSIIGFTVDLATLQLVLYDKNKRAIQFSSSSITVGASYTF